MDRRCLYSLAIFINLHLITSVKNTENGIRNVLLFVGMYFANIAWILLYVYKAYHFFHSINLKYYDKQEVILIFSKPMHKM